MFIRSLKLRNILSFREPPPLELRALNILIGPNASGKSNLIDCVGLIKELPNSVNQFVNDRGGPDAWVWRGDKHAGGSELECQFEVDEQTLNYRLQFVSGITSLLLSTEQLIEVETQKVYLRRAVDSFEVQGETSQLRPEISPIESALAAYKNPLGPVGIARAQHAFSDIRIYRGFNTEIGSNLRAGVASSGPKLPLQPDGSNLALVLQQLDFHGPLKSVKRYLHRLSDRFEDIKTVAEGARMQLYVEERGVGKVAATRLSDGTLRFLCLMAILFDPNPTSLVCIEEPEIGLHPEALALVGDALREVCQKMQLVITTHSDALVDRFTDEPESVVVCERGFDESTTFQRLSKDRLKEWLDEYTLGDLWRRGEIGGTQR